MWRSRNRWSLIALSRDVDVAAGIDRDGGGFIHTIAGPLNRDFHFGRL
jgi:hypothetical protein